MFNLHPGGAAVKDSRAGVHPRLEVPGDGPRDRPGAEPPPPKSWVLRIPVGFLDARKNGGLGHRFGWALLILEGYCRDRAFCWVGNAEAARALECNEGSLKRLLGEMQAAGLIHRVPTDEGRPGRLGIVLLRRGNPDFPVADRESLADVVALMRGPRGAKARPSGARKRAASRGAQARPGIKTLSFNEDEFESGREDAGDSTLQRQRPESAAEPPQTAPIAATAVAIAGDPPPSDPPDAPEPDPPTETPGPVGRSAEVEAEPMVLMAEVEVDRHGDADESAGDQATGPVGRSAEVEAEPMSEIPPAGSPRVAGEEGGDVGTEELVRWSRGANPTLAKIGRAGLAERGVRLEAMAPGSRPPAGSSPAETPRMGARPAAAGPVPPPAPTAGGSEYLASLTPGERARFDGLSAAKRAEHLGVHALGYDRVMAAHYRGQLAPPPSAAAAPPPATLAEAWERLPGAPPASAPFVAEWTCRGFGTARDQALWPAFHAVALAVWRGVFPAWKVVDALRQAGKPGVARPGALFNHALQAHGWRWDDTGVNTLTRTC